VVILRDEEWERDNAGAVRLFGYHYPTREWIPLAVNERGEMLTVGQPEIIIPTEKATIVMDAGEAKTVNNTASELLAANPDRVFALFQNIGSKDVTIGTGTPVAGQGIALIGKGASYLMTKGQKNIELGAIKGVTASGISTVIVVEGTEVP
jgi:hypothetical protein